LSGMHRTRGTTTSRLKWLCLTVYGVPVLTMQVHKRILSFSILLFLVTVLKLYIFTQIHWDGYRGLGMSLIIFIRMQANNFVELQVGLSWSEELPLRNETIMIAIEDTVRYDLKSPNGIIEWQALVPGNGIFPFGNDNIPHSIVMFHQLRCLDIIRAGIVQEREPDSASDGDTPLLQHCFNYLRQLIMCHGNTASGMGLNNPPGIHRLHTCRDFHDIYRIVKTHQNV